MSTPYVPVVRKEAVIGCMIRPGFVPGGFTHQFGVSKTRIGRARAIIHRDASREVREAANRVLEKRGLLNDPNMQDGTMHGGFRRY